MAKEPKQQLNVKLDPIKDQDIIDFLADRPRSWVVRQALREYMKNDRSVPTPEAKPRAAVNTTEPKTVVTTSESFDSSEDDPFSPIK